MEKNLRQERLEYLFIKVITVDDQDAFREIFYAFFAPLCHFAHHYTANTAQSEDLVQDVFYDIWEKRKHIQIKTSLQNYLVSSVRNRCIDYLRRQKVEKKYILRQTEQETDVVGNVYPLLELRFELEKAMKKLSPQSAEIFNLNRFSGLTYNEIATRLSISVKTVEAHMSRVLKFLQKELKDFLQMALIIMSANLLQYFAKNFMP